MPSKPPSKVTLPGHSHIRPETSVDTPPPRLNLTPRPGLDPTTLSGPSIRANKPTDGIDTDAIVPAPNVKVQAIVSMPDALAHVGHPPEHYRLSAPIGLPDADAEGLITFKGRHYVEMADGGFVQVGKDSQSGLWRARLASESIPSGPLMLHAPESGRWHALEFSQPSTFALSGARLQAFRTPLDFSTSSPDSDGLHRHDGKLYAVIDNHGYQVVHDPDASTPLAEVMRIVRPQDPVAADIDNIYSATRPGRSEPVVFDAHQGWRGIVVGGAGGMQRGSPDQPAPPGLRERLNTAINRLRTPQSRLRKLYPSLDSEQIRTLLSPHGDDVQGFLTRVETEYKTLKLELATWLKTSALAGGAAHPSVERAAQEIKRCWKRQTGTTLQLDLGDAGIAALSADFSHVRTLHLQAVAWSEGADTFLKGFTALEHLKINASALDKLPASLAQMRGLRELDLRANRIKLDEHSAGALSALHQLVTVKLSDNPLQISPDFSAMSGLQTLDLRKTGISEWPLGLADKTSLTDVDLSNNKLRDVPDAHINPPADQLAVVARINNHTRLEGNYFPSPYWRKFDAYWRRLNELHPELMTPLHPAAFDSENSRAQRYRRLFPGKTIKACREFIWIHDKGTVATRLLALEQDFAVLKNQLDDWVFSGGSNRLRYIRVNQLQTNTQTRNERIEARDRIISCWRRETPQKHAFDGTPIGLELDLSGLTLPTLPDLSSDFSHVGSLKLNNMNLTESPEGFLTRFRHLRWLNMANNRLRDLPPAIGEMHGMTRLFLQGNQLELTAETAQILAGRTTLRALWIHDNPHLSVSPDFSAITDMREVDMSNTGIENWPTGLYDQPLLGKIHLNNNRITTLPDFVVAPAPDRLVHSIEVNSGIQISGNPLSTLTQERLAAYAEQLNRSAASLHNPLNLLTTSVPVARPQPVVMNSALAYPQLTVGMPAAEAMSRTEQLDRLKAQEGSDGFFNIISKLAHHADFRRQVWDVVDAISKNSVQTRALRRDVFDRACEAGCTDLAAATFTDMQILTMTHQARVQARQDGDGTRLVELSRSLFRLRQVDDLAAAEIAASRAIVDDPQTSASKRSSHHLRLRDPHEMTMAYRFGLKDRLQLPFQPQTLSFIGMAGVTSPMLEVAYRKIIALNGSPEEFQALVSMDFWQDFITHKYSSRFDAARQPYQQKQAALDEQFATKVLTQPEYQTQTNDVTAQLAISEATLIQALTREEIRPGDAVETPASSETAAPTD